MSDLVPKRQSEITTRRQPDRAVSRIERQGQLAVARIEQQTLVRCAEVRGESIVQGEKLHEIDWLAHEAMSGQAFLSRWEGHLAGEDPVLRSDLHYFTEVAKVAKGEILADTIVQLRRL